MLVVKNSDLYHLCYPLPPGGIRPSYLAYPGARGPHRHLRAPNVGNINITPLSSAARRETYKILE